MAKALKQDIDKLRAAGEAAATGQVAELPKSRRATDPEEIFNRVLGKKASGVSLSRGSSGVPSEAGPSNAADPTPGLRSQPSGVGSDRGGGARSEPEGDDAGNASPPRRKHCRQNSTFL